MASEQDDNPFARNSAWPQMPQAPFRVGPLPKAAPSPAPAEPPPRTITPAFVRPAGPAAFAGLPGVAPPRPAQPERAPPAPPVVTEAPSVEPPRAETPLAAAPEPEPAPPPQRYIEVAPVIVQPVGAGVRKVHRKSPAPVIAATVAGLAAVLGVAYALSRGQEAALESAPAPRPAAASPVASA
ncbi:MAG: hypothetical protein JHD15_14060, partial [Phenylobacterium sp.]|nr:hypothetical protein [Phenylobacterium sp.]